MPFTVFITGKSHIEEVSSTANLCCINMSTQAHYCRPTLLSCWKFFVDLHLCQLRSTAMYRQQQMS